MFASLSNNIRHITQSLPFNQFKSLSLPSDVISIISYTVLFLSLNTNNMRFQSLVFFLAATGLAPLVAAVPVSISPPPLLSNL
jgi:hypothetical protein